MKPNYLVIGAAKCGSTTISALIGFHPEIYMVPHEVHFFAEDELYSKGNDWYEELFSPAENAKRIGENSNKYTMKELYPDVLSRLLSYTDPASLKLIYIVRHPLELMESFWIQKRAHRGEQIHYDFNVAVRHQPKELLHVANYWQQLEPYKKHFKEEQILVVFLEDLKANREETMRRCYEFLEVDPNVASDLPRIQLNPSKHKKVSRPFKSRLRKLGGYQFFVSFIPASVRKAIATRFLMKEVTGRPVWKQDVKAWAIQELAEDTQTFLKHYGKPADFWPMTVSDDHPKAVH